MNNFQYRTPSQNRNEKKRKTNNTLGCANYAREIGATNNTLRCANYVSEISAAPKLNLLNSSITNKKVTNIGTCQEKSEIQKRVTVCQ